MRIFDFRTLSTSLEVNGRPMLVQTGARAGIKHDQDLTDQFTKTSRIFKRFEKLTFLKNLYSTHLLKNT